MPPVDRSALLLDAGRMAALLRADVPQLRERAPYACRIHQSRRRISRKTEENGAPYLGVVYQLEVPDIAGVRQAPSRWCYVKAYSRGASRPEAAAPAVHLPDIDAVAWVIPDDPAMAQLRGFLDPDTVGSVLRETIGAPAAAAEGPGATSAAIVRHEPESHCTARFEIVARGRPRTLYGKTFADDAWRACAQRVRSLWQASRGADAFLIGRPVAESEALRALWQAPIEGTPLRTALQGQDAAMWLERVALGLRTLQEHIAPGEETPLTPTLLLERTAKQCRKLVRADSSLAAALDPVLQALQAAPPVSATPVTVHGDFHVDQMACNNGRVALFDFDNFAVGSPALDVADFVSQILTDAGFERQRRADIAAAFVAQCAARLPWRPSRAEFDWSLRLLLLRKAYSFFVRHRDGWRDRALEAAALAQRGGAFLWPRYAGMLS